MSFRRFFVDPTIFCVRLSNKSDAALQALISFALLQERCEIRTKIFWGSIVEKMTCFLSHPQVQSKIRARGGAESNSPTQRQQSAQKFCAAAC